MKRIAVILLIFVLLFVGCGSFYKEDMPNTEFDNKTNVGTLGVWLSFTEIANMLSSENGFENEVLLVLENLKELGTKEVYIHVRSHCDAIYKSDYFPLTLEAGGYSFDVLEYMINAFHNEGIQVHAWINPYRVSTATEDVNTIRADSPIHKWLTDSDPDNDKNVCVSSGVYLNPAESEVRRLVIDGIREILQNYAVDGIHFDDYFYPTTEAEFDSASFEEYKSATNNPLSLDDWRRANVNALISGCRTAIASEKENVVFSISPAASIENNYSTLYADVEYWVKHGLVDCIIPQLYFGFEYADSNFRFENLLKSWKKLMNANGDVDLKIGLGSYKIGTETVADGDEWQIADDIIARQAEICYEDERASGYVLFSYSALTNNAELNKKQLENIKKFNQSINVLSGEEI